MKFFFRTPLVPFVLVPLLIGEPVWAQTPAFPSSDETGGGSNLQLRVISADESRIPTGSRSTKGYTLQVTNASGAGVPDAAVAFRLPDSGSSGTFADGSHSAVAYTDNAGNVHVDGIRWSDTPGIAAVRITASKGNDHAGLLLEQTLVSSGATNAIAAPAEAVRSTPPPSPATVEASPSVRREQAAASLTAPAVSIESFGHKGEMPLNSPFNRSISANPLKTEIEPSVSIVSSSQEKLSSGSKKKWIILGIAIAVGAGAGAGFVFANRSSKSSSTTATTSSISFGSPTVSVGHP